MALIGGLAAATLVNASLVVAVIVSVVIGAIGAVVVFRSPAREPELTAPRTATMPRGPAAPSRIEPGRRTARVLPARPGGPGHRPGAGSAGSAEPTG